MVVALLAMPPLVITFFQGALSLLVTVAMLEAFIALRAGRDRAAAFWLVVARLSRRWRSRSEPPFSVDVDGGWWAGVSGWSRWRRSWPRVVMGVGIWPAYARFLGDYVGSSMC